MYPYSTYVGPKATLQQPLEGPSMYYLQAQNPRTQKLKLPEKKLPSKKPKKVEKLGFFESVRLYIYIYRYIDIYYIYIYILHGPLGFWAPKLQGNACEIISKARPLASLETLSPGLSAAD